VLSPVDEAGRFYPEYGWLAQQSTSEAADAIIADLRTRGLLIRAGRSTTATRNAGAATLH
jgi:isoleucyl-tRNA synthetase